MRIEMNNTTLQIKRLDSNDVDLFRELVSLFQEVFEMENRATPNESYLKSLLGKPGFIVLVLICENEIAGGLTAYELPLYYGEYSEVYIYDVAIKPTFQRRGFGKMIIAALKEYCRENRIKQFFVEAHEEDDEAVKFYYSTGGKAEKVVHFNYDTDSNTL
ncbi:MAG: GNAT family N-acetyltransferase [Chitinophagales bacterium]